MNYSYFFVYIDEHHGEYTKHLLPSEEYVLSKMRFGLKDKILESIQYKILFQYSFYNKIKNMHIIEMMERLNIILGANDYRYELKVEEYEHDILKSHFLKRYNVKK